MTVQCNDPTRMASSPVGGTGGEVLLSLSETHALCAKAARGAGFDWGHAEEAGHAAAWLAARGLPGCALLLQCLQTGPLSPPCPRPGEWSSKAPQCPLRTGVALVDHVNLPEVAQDNALTLVNIALPGLLLPFAALAARLKGGDVTIAANSLQFTLPANGNTSCQGAMTAFCALYSADVRLIFGLGTGLSPQRDATAAALPSTPQDVWRALDVLALRVTVPPSEHSSSGAGGRGSDND